MNSVGFEYDVKINLEFTKVEIEHLCSLAMLHYDLKCINAAMQGGMLYGMQNEFHLYNSTTVTRGFNGIELRLLHKITESETLADTPMTRRNRQYGRINNL